MFRFAFGLFCLLLPLTLAAGPSFTVKPAPAWVRPVEVSTPADGGGADGGSGAVLRLVDHQYRVAGGRTEHYQRRVERVVSAAGLENAAQLQLNFEPTYQSLVIHYIRIQRGAQVINALRPREIKIIQNEDELRDKLYNGELTALAFLNDVRVGDVIDYAYSVNGDNPVLGGRFAAIYYLGDAQPVERLRHRLLWPAGRNLYFRADGADVQPAVQPLGAETEYVWERRNAPKFEQAKSEDRLPNWYNPYPQVQLSDFADWAEVARWAVPLYAARGPLSAGLAAQIAKWKAAPEGTEAGLLAALRFVQDEVRYLGIENGPYSHQPSSPSDVFERRFGDCKDKSLLLATVLRAFGYEAYPALVHSERGRALTRWQPSPFAFDHVITKAVINGRTYWIDPTISHQRGPLAERYNPALGFALVVSEGSRELEPIPPPDAQAAATPTIFVKEVYRAPGYSDPVTLEVTTRYLGPDADELRAHLATHSRQELTKHFIEPYAESYPSIEAVEPPQVRDDEAANLIVVTEKYRLPDFWRNRGRRVLATQIYQHLDRPRSILQRRAPLALTYPLSIRQSIEIELPERVLTQRDAWPVASDEVRFEARMLREGRTVKLDYEFTTLRDEVSVDRLGAYLDTLDKIEDQLAYGLTRGAPRMRTNDAAMVVGGVLLLLAVLAVPVVVIGLILWVKRRRVKTPEPEEAESTPAPPAPGSLPDVAIELRSAEEMEQYVSGLRCDCGNPFRQPGEPLRAEGLIFDGRRLLNVALRCVRCGTARDWYFMKPPPPPFGAEYSES